MARIPCSRGLQRERERERESERERERKEDRAGGLEVRKAPIKS